MRGLILLTTLKLPNYWKQCGMVSFVSFGEVELLVYTTIKMFNFHRQYIYNIDI